MKTTIIPAQITSIEDTIAANLTLTQIILLILPVFLSAIIFSLLPPFIHIRLYKLVLIAIMSIPLALLALRINGQVLLKLIIVIVNYCARPKLYLLTNQVKSEIEQIEPEVVNAPKLHITTLQSNNRPSHVTPAQMVLLADVLENKKVLFFTNSEGRLNAIIQNK